MALRMKNQLLLASLFTVSAVTSAQAAPSVEFGGVVEVSVSKAGSAEAQSKVDTVELAITGKVSEQVSAEVVLLDEDLGSDDHTGLAVDTAIISLATAAGNVSLGKMKVPFTTGETNMVTDSAALEEPVGYGVALSGALQTVEYTIYVADPDKDYTGAADQAVDAFGDVAGLNINIPLMESVSLNGSFISLNGNHSWSGALLASRGHTSLIVEATSMDGEAKSRSNVELAYDLGFGTAALAVQEAGDGTDYVLAGFSTEIYQNTSLNLEANNNTTADEITYTAQVAVEF